MNLERQQQSQSRNKIQFSIKIIGYLWTQSVSDDKKDNGDVFYHSFYGLGAAVMPWETGWTVVTVSTWESFIPSVQLGYRGRDGQMSNGGDEAEREGGVRDRVEA